MIFNLSNGETTVREAAPARPPENVTTDKMIYYCAQGLLSILTSYEISHSLFVDVRPCAIAIAIPIPIPVDR